MEKRESISWIFGVVASVIAIGSAWIAYHSVFAKQESVDAGIGAVFLFLKSQNENIQRYYEDNIEKGQDVDQAERRLQGLEYEEQYIDNVQEALGVKDG
jgi:hypothetical protein